MCIAAERCQKDILGQEDAMDVRLAARLCPQEASSCLSNCQVCASGCKVRFGIVNRAWVRFLLLLDAFSPLELFASITLFSLRIHCSAEVSLPSSSCGFRGAQLALEGGAQASETLWSQGASLYFDFDDLDDQQAVHAPEDLPEVLPSNLGRPRHDGVVTLQIMAAVSGQEVCSLANTAMAADVRSIKAHGCAHGFRAAMLDD